MLDSETKGRIDSARDILVGKVPDPKSQVEQITIALIYKFMDDMDRQSEELGGKATFFTGEFKKYRWANLLDKRLGGHERLILYAEGIEKMNVNKNIPQLFRDIFKGVFLPYRDPETLNLFLKEINGFTYEHSERLGDAYEYLLSVLGTQGDAGQFRTPRHIIDFIVAVVDPQKNETVLDPACGTAGFLISAFKWIVNRGGIADCGSGIVDLKKESSTNQQSKINNPQSTIQGQQCSSINNQQSKIKNELTPDERARLMTNFRGYDIAPDMVRLSRANLYLHGFPNPVIHEYDTLTSEERWDERCDVIMANPPFMTPKGGIRPHNRFSIKAKRSEVLFVDYIAEHLNPSGRAGIIVPEGIIFQSQNAYKALRKMLAENYLWAVVSLPAGVFNPYSGVKTSILFLDRNLAKRTDAVLFVKIENDGFDLGAQRRPIEPNDLPEALNIIADFRLRIADLKKDSGSSNPQSTISNPKCLAVSRKRLLESGDINLSGDRYRVVAAVQSKWPMVSLDELSSEIRNGVNVEQSDQPGKYRVSRIQTISNWVVDLDKTKWTNDEPRETDFLQEGDVLLSHINSIEHLAKSAIFTGIGERVVHGINLIKFRPKRDLVHAKYLHFVMRSEKFVDRAKTFAQKAVNQASIKLSDLKSMQIPLPPLEIQRQMVAELDGYRKVIEGARQVIANYKPTIKIDPRWLRVRLGEACESIMDGTHFSPKSAPSGDYLYITAKNIKENRLDMTDVTYVTKEDHKTIYERCPVLKGDVLYIKDGATTGIAVVNPLEDQFSLLSSVAVLRGEPSRLDNSFLCYYLNSAEGKSSMLSMVAGVAITRLTLAKLNSATIPLPPLDIQREIVAEIEVEWALVEAERKLVEIFEKKIQAKLAEIWGEDKN